MHGSARGTGLRHGLPTLPGPEPAEASPSPYVDAEDDPKDPDQSLMESVGRALRCCGSEESDAGADIERGNRVSRCLCVVLPGQSRQEGREFSGVFVGGMIGSDVNLEVGFENGLFGQRAEGRWERPAGSEQDVSIRPGVAPPVLVPPPDGETAMPLTTNESSRWCRAFGGWGTPGRGGKGRLHSQSPALDLRAGRRALGKRRHTPRILNNAAATN